MHSDAHPQLQAGYWYACEYPERPADEEWTIFDMRCSSCVIARQAAMRSFGWVTKAAFEVEA